MKRIYNFILLVCLVQLAVAQNRIAEIRENLLGNYSDRVLVVSHRADWRNAPENSLQGIRNCIDMGVDMVAIRKYKVVSPLKSGGYALVSLITYYVLMGIYKIDPFFCKFQLISLIPLLSSLCHFQ